MTRARRPIVRLAVALLLTTAVLAGAQTGARRAAALGALVAFPGFYQGQAVVVRGNLVTKDQAVLIAEDADRSVPVIFAGSAPQDGRVEVRGTFWDVGRLQPEDPRLASLGLDRLVPRGFDNAWPRPGETLAITVTDAMTLQAASGAGPSLREIVLEPARYAGQSVKIAGQFRGRNLYADVPQGPGLSEWDFVLRSADAALWVTGRRPRGRGFNLNTSARVDTSAWLEATGVVRQGQGLVWIEAQQLALTKPEVEVRRAEAPPPPLVGPPPEVIFSDPLEGDIDITQTAPVRLQFSRDMDPASFDGRVVWSFSGETSKPATFKYDRARRALEVQITPGDGAAYRTVVLQLREGIAAGDGAPMKPWSLTFSFGPS